MFLYPEKVSGYYPLEGFGIKLMKIEERLDSEQNVTILGESSIYSSIEKRININEVSLSDSVIKEDFSCILPHLSVH